MRVLGGIYDLAGFKPFLAYNKSFDSLLIYHSIVAKLRTKIGNKGHWPSFYARLDKESGCRYLDFRRSF